MAPTAPPHRYRSLSDLLVILGGVLVFFLAAIHFELAERLAHWTHGYEHLQLDEVPLSLLVLSLGLVWFAWRRWRELKREMQMRSRVEEANRDTLAQNRRLAQQLIAAQESERRHIARELHDVFGQCCVAIKVDAALMAREAAPAQAPIHRGAQRIADTADHLHGVLRSMLQRLRPTGLDELGLASSLQLLLDDWQARHGLPCTFRSGEALEALDTLDEASTLTLYRAVQEGLTNIARHAQARQAEVALDRVALAGRDHLRLTVADNGVGLPGPADAAAGAAGSAQGLGIVGMRERVQALGGLLTLQNRARGGTQLQVLLPLPGQGAAP